MVWVHNILLLGSFYALHSFLASEKAKSVWNISPLRYRKLYVLISIITLALVIFAWKKISPSDKLTSFSPVLRGLGLLVNLMGLVGFFWVSKHMSWRSFLGLKSEQEQFTASGPYAIVRHPSYFFLLLILVPSQPNEDAFLIFGITLVYVCIATRFEEARLMKTFGDKYVRYAKRTPRLWPLKLRRPSTNE